jgi:hypothetical protein
MTRPPFPSVLDSSLIAAFRSCPTKAKYEYVLHWKPRSPSVHLHAGAAFARGLEVARKAYYLGEFDYPEGSEIRSAGLVQDSIACGLQALMAAYGEFECPADSPKSLERMMGAFEFYFDAYPLERDHAVPITLPSGRRGIEFSFVEPLDIAHPETGEPLLYSGRMDMVAQFSGSRFGEDDKTTSQLGASWSKQWDLRSQFTSYCWGAARAGLPLSGFIVRGVSILKTRYDTQQAITYRPQWMIDQWYEQLIERDIPSMIGMWESGKWGMDLDHACNEYGGCPFRQICLSQPSDRLAWLESGFERRQWDPVTRTETRL